MERENVIDKTMTFTAANLWGGLFAIAFTAIFFWLYFNLWGEVALPSTISWPQITLFILALLVSIIIHELLHGLGYALGGAAWSQIQFGVRKLSPYAHCSVPIKRNSYRLAVALPGIILGLLPALVGIVGGSISLLLFGTFMTVSAAGDGLVLWLLRDAPKDALIFDHPTKVGCELHLNLASDKQ